MRECPKCHRQNRDEEGVVYCKWCGAELKAKAPLNPPLMGETNSELSLTPKGEISSAKSPSPKGEGRGGAFLDSLVGLDSIKTQLKNVVRTHVLAAQRGHHHDMSRMNIGKDMLILGNSGTGKTSLAEIIYKLFEESRIIEKPLFVTVPATDLERKLQEWEAGGGLRGGIVCIDNLHEILKRRRFDLVERLMTQMESWNNDPITIITSTSVEMKQYLFENPSVANRFEHKFELKDYDGQELAEICRRNLDEEYSLTLTEEAMAKLVRVFNFAIKDRTCMHRNGHLAAKKCDDIFEQLVLRDAQATEVLPEDIPGEELKTKTFDEIMAELDRFVGIGSFKQSMERIMRKMEFERMRRGAGGPMQIRDHFLFLGNPGTGKTTLAKVFAEILNATGILPGGQLVEVSRKDLVAAYVGQTAIAVQKKVDEGMGGVLFIDEAYSLKQGDNDQFGQEAVDALIKLMEDNRGKFVCVAAGYTREMEEFLQANSGLASRFNETITFEDYKPEDLAEIFRRMVKAEGLELSPDAEEFLPRYFKQMYLTRTRTFGNAREVRNSLERAMKNMAKRQSEAPLNPPLRGETDSELSPSPKGEGRGGAFAITKDDIIGHDPIWQDRDLKTVWAELDNFIGMESVKQEIHKLANKISVNRKMQEMGIGEVELNPIHIVLTGIPGTGKTSLANLLGDIFQGIGLLPTAKVIVKERKHLLSQYKNETAKLMDRAVDEAMGGILFIDEAYSLMPIGTAGDKDQSGQEAIESLMTRMVSDAGKFIVIMAGYRKEMEEFINNANPGLRRRFTTFLHIDDYNELQLKEIYLNLAAKKQNIITPEASERLTKCIAQMIAKKDENFGNAGEMVKLLDQTIERRANRLAEEMERQLSLENVEKNDNVDKVDNLDKIEKSHLTKEDFLTILPDDIPFEEPKTISIEDCLGQLDSLVGLQSVKDEIRSLATYLQVEKAKADSLGKDFRGIADHYLFVGNPGTGKTTVARIMGNILQSLGVLPVGHTIEVTRRDLVEGYLGQTAPKTARMVRRAVGGILFIDEAYSLASDDFGQEATNTLLPMLLDYKGKMVCIAAGYPREISEWIATNSGLASRFTRTIHFEDYNAAELAEIFRKKAAAEQLTLTPEADTAMAAYFENLYANRGENFGNARDVGNYFEAVKKRQSARLVKEMQSPGFDKSRLIVIEKEDI